MTEPRRNGDPNPYAPTIVDGDVGRDPSDYLASLASLDTPHGNDQIVPPGQRPCPICRELMQSRPYKSVSVDFCAEHGMWLDHGKLESLTENISVSARLKQRRDVEKIRNHEKMKGIFGLFGYFVD